MTGRSNCLLFCLLAVLAPMHFFAQCSLEEVSLDDKINESTLIVEGKVISATCFYNASHTFIYTSNEVEVYKLFKGNNTAKTIKIITEGGQIGTKLLKVNPSPNIKVGDVGIFTAIPFNDTSLANSFKLYSGVQGFFKYDLNKKTAAVPFKSYTDIKAELYNVIAKNIGTAYLSFKSFELDSIVIPKIDFRAPGSITAISPTTISAGTYSVLTITGTGFGNARGSSTVSFSNADDGGQTTVQPLTQQYVSWTNTQIKVIVPDQAGTGPIEVNASKTMVSNDTLFVNYAEINVSKNNFGYYINLINANNTGGITWNMNRNIDTSEDLKQSFLRAMKTWSCNTGINWKLGTITSINKSENDNMNVVTFDEHGDLAKGTLAVCYNYWNGCDSSTTWFSQEMDVVISKDVKWQYGPAFPSNSQFDFESVILHELGHGHQLGHVIDYNDVMNYSIYYGITKRDLQINNLMGAGDVMNRSTVSYPCSNKPMIALTASNCNDDNAIIDNDLYTVFPNPSSGYVYISVSDKKQSLKIDCFSATGARIKSFSTSDSQGFVSLDLSDLAMGLYVLVIDNGADITRKKLLIARSAK